MLTDEILILERRGFPWRWVIPALATLLLASVGAAVWLALRSAHSIPHYVTVPVQRTDLAETVAATGPIIAPTAVPLTFKNAGRVIEIDVKVGDTVRAGQVLAKLDPTDFQQQLLQAEANLEAAQANYNKLIAGPLPADITSAQAAVDAAERQLADARANLQAVQEQASKDVALAQASIQTAQTNLALAQASLKSTKDQQAKILAADRVAITIAQKNLDAVKATAAANQSVLEQLVEKAKDDLWVAQTNRDGICGRSKGADCSAANASVGAAQTAVTTAQAQLAAGQKQGAQQIAQAQAQLDQAQAQLASDQAKADSAVSAAQGQVKQAQDALNTAEKSAADAQARAAVALQAARAQVNTAMSALQTARANYEKITTPPSPAEIANAKAQVAAQQALVNIARANLDATTLRAPTDGIITAINGTVGQWLTGGATSGLAANAASGVNNSSSNNATSFISLTNLNNLQIQAQVNEADVGRLKIGQPVSFTVDAFPGQTFHGTVSVIQSLGTTNQNVVTYPVLITIDRTPVKLLPGMTANVTIAVGQKSNVLVVPAAAISFAQAQTASSNQTGTATGGPSVLVVGDDGKATIQPIQTGVSDGQYTEVLSGLQAGQRVAVGVKRD
ncbi:MAG: HlyD family efflux transporter periplasmic adaptor subunit [Chloroflexi bacterium]|nr:HlyD family efflux transporter periplasmic adaptor subunit [Chloroflexota bacterium]